MLAPSSLLVLEFISPFEELWSPLEDTLWCQGVSSHRVLGNPCAEEDKLWSGDIRGCSSLLMDTYLAKVSLLCHGVSRSNLVHSVQFLAFQHSWYQRQWEGWWGAGLPPHVKAALLLSRVFWGTSGGLLGLSQAAKWLFNGCVKLVTPGGVILKFLKLKAQVFARIKRLSCVIWGWYTLL